MELALGVLIDVVGFVKATDLQILIGKGLGCTHTGKATFYLGVDIAGSLLHSGRGLAHPFAQQYHHQQKHRDHKSYHQSKPPLDDAHDDQGTDDGQNRGDQIFRAVVGKLCDLKKVGGQAAHQLAGAVAVIEVEIQALQVTEQISTNVRLHPDAEGMTVIADDILQERPNQIAG